jgi:hypothetical protein
MNTTRTLTARGVRSMLARRGVDHSALVIAETVNGFEVRIEGPKEARREAVHALAFDWENAVPGMSVAPYPDHDFLCRR